MPIPNQFEGRLKIPAIAAPMFFVSGPNLVVEACKHGVIGAFPSLNQRTSQGFDAWLIEIKSRIQEFESETGKLAAPYAVNLMLHRTNPRYDTDLQLSIRHQVPLIIGSLGAVADLVEKVHNYAGKVFHAVSSVRHAEKAAAAGVDGLVLVCAGAGGHAGALSPFSFIPEVRNFFNGTIVLAGCISTGHQILAAEALGADMAYLGTRFIATQEALCNAAYKQMVVNSDAADIICTAAFTGVPANYMLQSVIAGGFDPEKLIGRTKFEMAEATSDVTKGKNRVWSAGQGCGSVNDILPTGVLCDRLIEEYHERVAAFLYRLRGGPFTKGDSLGETQ